MQLSTLEQKELKTIQAHAKKVLSHTGSRFILQNLHMDRRGLTYTNGCEAYYWERFKFRQNGEVLINPKTLKINEHEEPKHYPDVRSVMEKADKQYATEGVGVSIMNKEAYAKVKVFHQAAKVSLDMLKKRRNNKALDLKSCQIRLNPLTGELELLGGEIQMKTTITCHVSYDAEEQTAFNHIYFNPERLLHIMEYFKVHKCDGIRFRYHATRGDTAGVWFDSSAGGYNVEVFAMTMRPNQDNTRKGWIQDDHTKERRKALERK